MTNDRLSHASRRRRRRFAVALLVCLPASLSWARPGSYGQIEFSVTPHEAGAPCRGGNVARLLGLQRLPEGPVVSDGVDFEKIPPGQYHVYYETSAFMGKADACSEISPPFRETHPWERVPKVEVEVQAGKVYLLSVDPTLAPRVEVLDDLPLTDRRVGGIHMLARALPFWAGICDDIFPGATPSHRQKLASSSVPAYARLFGLPERVSGGEDRATRLQQAQMTEQRASQWCSSDFTNAVEHFDRAYGSRVEAVRSFLLEDRVKAGTRTVR